MNFKRFVAVLLVLGIVLAFIPAVVFAAEVETVPMYRLYNSWTGEHFYTGSEAERDNLTGLGWSYEGVGWNSPVSGGEPVYRVYNPWSGDHHYTVNWEEVEMLVTAGWKYENVAWNSAGEGGVPQYRLWNPWADLGSHHYTSSTVERDYLLSIGWQSEGIGWYGVAAPAEPEVPEGDTLTLDHTEITLEEGEVFRLYQTYTGTGPLTWTSSDTSVATVSNGAVTGGTVTGKSAGTAYITVSDGTKNAQCKVTVTAKPVESTVSLTMDQSTATVEAGSTVKLTATYTGTGALTWSSNNTSVAIVNSNYGKVTGKSAGTAIITVTNGTISASCTVTVTAPASTAKVTSINMRASDGPIYNGVTKYAGDYVWFVVYTQPNEATRDIVVTSSNSSVVSVSYSGSNAGIAEGIPITLKFHSAGSAVITLTSGDGAVTQSYTINVKGGYDFNPGGGQLSPEEFASYTTRVMCANGFTETACGSWRLLTLTADELTFARAVSLGQSKVHEFWVSGNRYCQIVYVGQNEDGNYQFHLCWG